MAQKPKFELKDNILYVVEITNPRGPKEYPPPKDNPDWGSSFMYFLTMKDASVDDRYPAGTELVWFATEYAHDKLQDLGAIKGTVLKVAKVQDDQDKRKKNWAIEFVSGPVSQGQPAQNQQPQQPPQQSQQPPQGEEPPPPHGDEPPHPADGPQPTQHPHDGQSPPQQRRGPNPTQIMHHVLTTMDYAYCAAEVIQAEHSDFENPFTSSDLCACAHSIYIELNRKGWVPPKVNEDLIAKVRDRVMVRMGMAQQPSSN